MTEHGVIVVFGSRGTEGDVLKEGGRKEKRALSKSFRVVIRLCPQDQRDPRADEARSSIKVEEPNRIVVDRGRGHQPHSLDFDAVWCEKGTQKDVYESTAKPLVEALLQGYNGCVITYGSPGSGKSYTLLGGSLTGKQRGIISRAAEDIFNTTEALNCKIRVSFIHVANEKIYDLLESPPAEVCRIHEGEEMVFLEGLKEVEVGSSQDLLHLYKRGSANRHAGVSKGEFASKSHTIFNIVAISTNLREESDALEVTVSKLTLVDLASSGKAAPRSSALGDGKRSFHTIQENPQEAKILKRSLTIFGNVIFALSSAACQHVPYRESKLTRILRDCLGGNCQTCLIVTVSSNLVSVTETLSSLQFACRAMAIPGRVVHTSHLRCSPVQSVKVAEKARCSPGRHTVQLPCTPDSRGIQSQTSLPPILPGPAQACGPFLRPQEEGDLRAFLPQLDRAGPAEGGGRSGRPGRGARPSEERGGVWSRSSSLAGPQVPEAGGRERPPNLRPEALPSPRISVDRLPPSLPPPAAAPIAPVGLECPNCKRERKIREEYDKYVIQARRDRDGLSQRVTQLEAELQGREAGSTTAPSARARTGAETASAPQGEGADSGACGRRQRKAAKSTASQTEPSPSETESDRTRQQMVSAGRMDDGLRRETEALRGQLEESRGKERALAASLQAERGRGAQEAEELRAQLDRGREKDRQLGLLQRQKESLMLELQDSEAVHDRFREDAVLTVTGLQKQKKELLSQLDEAKIFCDKVRAENAGLREQLEALLARLRSGPRPDSPARPAPPHVHTVTTNTEMLLLSHHVSQQCAPGPGAEGGCFFSGCTGFQSSAFPGKQPEYSTTQDNDDNLPKMKDIFKQLRREHSLLLDVMLILYRRGWFAADAIPYVRRTLRKCGMRLKDTD
ncbi:kinesin-related protein 3 [Conger conger]|uniref:kinesin-related protein 3 n=1 Tax=Conger conger TaxID=82655 RepID=UPI002A5AD352|nr:kinesin-related protein 3 [Conger conger]